MLLKLLLMLLVVALLGLLLVLGRGWRAMRAYRLRRGLMDRQIRQTAPTPLDVAVSVVVLGEDRPDRIPYLLRLNYARYEVVFLCDLLREPTTEQLLARYSMMQVEYQSTGEFADSTTVRGVYRSRSRQFRHLVVVDIAARDSAELFNVGAEVAQYDRLLFLDQKTLPIYDALAFFNLDLAQYEERWAYAQVAFRGQLSACRLCRRMRVSWRRFWRAAVWNGRLERCRPTDVTVLFDRRAILAVGGFTRGQGDDVSLLHKIQQHYHSNPLAGDVLLLPEVIAFDDTQVISPDLFVAQSSAV